MVPVSRALLGVIVVLACSRATIAQTVYYAENFDSGIPPGYLAKNNNGSASAGWGADPGNFATPGIEHEDEFGIGQVDNDLDTVDFDLSAASVAYLHFETMTHWANFQANHPASLGNGVSAIEVSMDGGATWTSGLWVGAQTTSGLRQDVVLDLTAYVGPGATKLRFHYEGNYAHNWAVDTVQVDDDPSYPSVPGSIWNFVALPTSFVAASGFIEDFDANPGVIQPYMAITEVNAATLLPDLESRCNIGQHGAHLGNPQSGSNFAELSKQPTATSSDPTRNALVLGLNGADGMTLGFQLYEGTDELDAFDGVWISDDGVEWYRLHNAESNANSWVAVTGLPLDQTPADVSGDFYLMFAQEDNYPWPIDGIGYDDIFATLLPPPGPYLTLQGACGVFGASSILFTGGTPNSAVALVWSTTTGTFAVPTGSFACVGTLFDLAIPTVAKIGPADASGTRIFSPSGVPAAACGSVLLQALDSGTCVVSNVLAL